MFWGGFRAFWVDLAWSLGGLGGALLGIFGELGFPSSLPGERGLGRGGGKRKLE